MSLVLTVITSYQEFKQHSTSWEIFRKQQNDNAICNNWHWLKAWIDVFWQPKDQLYIHIWYYQEKIIGIIPCYLKKTFAGNELRFLATGEPQESEVCSEFQDFLLSEKFKEEILTQFTCEVLANNNISAITFENTLTTSIAYQWFKKLTISHWKNSVNKAERRYLIPVRKTQHEQISSFKSKNIKRHAKKVLVDTSWDVIIIDDASSLATFYHQLAEEHNKSWNGRGKTGAFEQTDFVVFHLKFSQKMFENNKLVAFKLTLGNEFLALFYGIIDGDTLYYYQSAINHNSKLSSAGVAMHITALDIARENNLAFYDLMKGDVNSYKKQYIKSDIQVVSASMYTLKYKYLMNFVKVFQKLIMKVEKVLKVHN